MRKLHQMEIPDPLVSEGEYIEYTANNGMVFHVMAVSSARSGYCDGCTFLRFKRDVLTADDSRYICDCGPIGENSLCYKGLNGNPPGAKYCRFVDINKALEDL